MWEILLITIWSVIALTVGWILIVESGKKEDEGDDWPDVSDRNR